MVSVRHSSGVAGTVVLIRSLCVMSASLRHKVFRGWMKEEVCELYYWFHT